MDKELMCIYAATMLDAGLGVGEGTRLRIVGDFPHRELMHAIAEGAYQRGAALVRTEYDDRRLTRIRADSSRSQYLDAGPVILQKEAEVFAAEGWYSLRLAGDEDPDALVGADKERLMRIQRGLSGAVTALRSSQMSSRIPWCVVPAATEAWAKKVLGMAASAADLWGILISILRLDQADPAAALRRHMANLELRCRKLNALALRELHFVAPGTDLTVHLASESCWQGGGSRTPSKHYFMPNIPSEECFTTPDCRGTEGYATLTKPVRILGSLVENGRLRFAGGIVTDCSAERGAEALERYLQTDPGARRLGEVALVDCANPIGRGGLVFDSPLIDENAASHIALGAGHAIAFAGADTWSEAERAERGFNDSLVHADVMIGSPEMDVIAVDDAGQKHALLRKGSVAERMDERN
jgi:aminopeptidase